MTSLGAFLLLATLLLSACVPGPSAAPAGTRPSTEVSSEPTVDRSASPVPSVAPTSTVSATSEAPSTLYVDDRCGVQFQLPSHWVVAPASLDAIEAVTVIESKPSDDAGTEGLPSGLKVQLRCNPADSTQRLRVLVEGELAREREGGNEGVATPVIAEPEPVTVNDQPALTTTIGEAESSTRIYYIVYPPDSADAQFVALSFTPAHEEADAVAMLLASLQFVER